MSVFVRDYKYNLDAGQVVKIIAGGNATYFGFLAGFECECTFDSQSPLTMSSGLSVEFTGNYEQVEIKNIAPTPNPIHVVVGNGKVLDSRLSIPPFGLAMTVQGVSPAINPENRLPVITPKDLARFQIKDFSNLGQNRTRLFVPGTDTPSAEDTHAADILIRHTANTDNSPLFIHHGPNAATSPDSLRLDVGDSFTISGPIYISDAAHTIYVNAQTGDSAIETAGRFFS